MMEQDAPDAKPKREITRTQIDEVQREVDARDETIRLLNEALSRALDELARGDRQAA